MHHSMHECFIVFFYWEHCRCQCVYWSQSTAVLLLTTMLHMHDTWLSVLYPHYCWQFIYANDICCVTWAETFAKVECTLTCDLAHLAEFCRRWHLKPNLNLHNASVSCGLPVTSQTKLCTLRYIWESLRHTLSYKQHLGKTAAKLQSRNNIVK